MTIQPSYLTAVVLRRLRKILPLMTWALLFLPASGYAQTTCATLLSGIADAGTETTADCNVLLGAKSTLEGSGGNLNWGDDGVDFEDWDGVFAEVSSGGVLRVTDIFLSFHDLSGTIPAALGQLTALEHLELKCNALSGSIPTELGQLTALEHLDLWGNALSGSIPAELGQLTALGHLDLDGNALSGSIPVELGQLTALDFLDLRNNALSGAIPVELGQLTSLEDLYLYGNDLSGPIPTELGQLTGLGVLELHNNRLSGSIPAELGQLTELLGLDLSNNRLSGPIPAELGRLTSLTCLSLGGNDLSGPIPAALEGVPACSSSDDSGSESTEERVVEDAVTTFTRNTTQVVTGIIGDRIAGLAGGVPGGGGAQATIAGRAVSLDGGDWETRLAEFVYQSAQRLDAGGEAFDWRAAAGDSRFTLPFRGLALWGDVGVARNEYDADGTENDTGTLSVLIGADGLIADDWRVGVAVGHSLGDTDYTQGGVQGEIDQSMTSVNPYIAWYPKSGLSLWASGGYGFGTVEDSEFPVERDAEQWLVAGGVQHTSYLSPRWEGTLRGKAFWSEAEVDGATHNGMRVSTQTVEVWRVRAESELGYRLLFAGGNVRPYGLLGGRWDGGDGVADDYLALDAGGGFELLMDNGLAFKFALRRQVTGGDYEEDSLVASGSMRYDVRPDGRGLSVSLERSLGGEPAHWDIYGFDDGNDETRAEWRPVTVVELGYGWGLSHGTLRTYTRNNLDDDRRRHALGLGMTFQSLTLDMETGYSKPLNAAGTDLNALLRATLRW